MYIQNKPASALYKMFIGILAVVGFWLSISEFGASAWRLLSTSVLLVAAVYYLASALVIALSKKRDAGQIPCPMLEGMLIVSASLVCVATIIYHLQGIAFPGAGGWHASLIYFVTPFLILSDWVLFTKKGQWHIGHPFYWLAPAICYAALIILTASSLSESDPFRYPASFLDFEANGLIPMLEWFALIAILVLAYGYVLFLIDCAASGKIAKYIVLPRVKTIVLEEDDESKSVKPEPKIERVEVKLEPMEPVKNPSASKGASNVSSKNANRSNGGKKKSNNRSANTNAKRNKSGNTDGIKPKNPGTKKPNSSNNSGKNSNKKTATTS